MLSPCISYDLRTGTIAFTLAAENGNVHHAETVTSALNIRSVYASTRRAMPSLPEWETIGDRLIRQYDLLRKDQTNKREGAIAA